MNRAASWYSDATVLLFGTYTAAQAGQTQFSGDARGCVYTIYVKTAGGGNIQARVSSIEPFEGNGSQYTQNVTITAPGVYVIAVGPGCCFQPPGEAADTVHANIAQTVAIPLAGKFRVSFAKSTSDPWVLGISARRWR